MQEIVNDMTPAVNMRLAYTYVLPQTFENLYSPEEALQNGTLFRALHIPMEVYGPMGN
ncbi:MAG: spore coat associated protein CotJA [Clostridia bacterium]|nr:spore coat associated protein CotJA [Clostridia bacterium]